MTATAQRTPPDFWDKWDSTRLMEVTAPPPRPAEAMNEPPGAPRPRPVGRRASRAFLRFVITLGIGVGGTLGWQAYGDDARQLLATAYPQQLGWVAPETTAAAPATQSPPAEVASNAPSGPSLEQQQLNALSLNLAAVRQSVEQLATALAASQQQMSADIARLQASDQEILTKIAMPPPRPAPPAHKPAPQPQAIVAPAQAH